MSDTGNGTAKPTVSQALGEIVWILTQSRFHKHHAISDLEWMVMPPVLAEQFRIFRAGGTPVGYAVWAYLSEDAETRLRDQAESGVGARLSPDDWKAGDRLWLVDLVAVEGPDRDKVTAVMLEDLRVTALTGKRFKFHVADPATGRREVQERGPS